ncbi:right-handed parallel beta-helix repeat-containing protein [Euzebyella saccharophila]|uniref:Right-handed parallel beta-helix repeat-containing protein n=1 Tax=Euzebyella saccharophila TaxID=679664 RepID=A0ABV8JTF0_9FLAO|nr:right-handed parallel beta-helix repeat-containing protein [Euzebyella saccharophila]
MKKNFLISLTLILSLTLNAQKINISNFGFSADDSSEFINQAIESNFDTIVFTKQKSDWISLPIKLTDVSNKVIIFEDGVKLCAKEGEFLGKNDALISIQNSRDIELYGINAELVMNKEEYQDGEWRHCISIKSSNNILIKGLTLRDSGGDGIYISGSKNGKYSQNILIDSIISNNNKRQGLSIISGKNVLVKNSSFLNTKGTLPGAGLDIEPNSSSDILDNIVFKNCLFRNNDHSGISIALQKLDNTSKPVDISFFECVIENNHSFENKYVASEIVFHAKKNNPVKGTVLLEDCLIKNSKWGICYSRKTSDSYRVIFRNCVASNICQDESYPVIYLEVPDYYTGEYTLGGFVFENLVISYETNVPYFVVRGSKMGTLKSVSDVHGKIILDNVSKVGEKYISYSREKNEDFNLDVIK